MEERKHKKTTMRENWKDMFMNIMQGRKDVGEQLR